MARYSHSSSYRSSGFSRSGGYRGGGFTKSNGTHVSAARAHQHTGQSFGGYTKTHNSSTGHYSMRPSGKGR